MKTMDHQQAIKMQAAERYLLEELSEEERESFEDHYFTCTECADEVKAAYIFADNAKAVMADWPAPAPREERQSFNFWEWLRPVLVPAMAVLLLGVTVYQSVLVIPRLERQLETATAPRALPSVVARAATRGEPAVVQLSSNDQFVQVILDINTTQPVSSYSSQVYDESGNLRFTIPSVVPSGGGSLNLLLPASELKAGPYTIKVGPSETDDYSFVVQRR
jgi:hypothetical protein